jgi:hypothetical protein
VVNRGEKPILLIDGEELAGAKQNRVLNTSILVKENSEIRVPVSCTEQGRWSYASAAFEQSGNVMAHKIRARKVQCVSDSLHHSSSFASDQGEVWNEIQMLAQKAKAESPTSAMRHIFAAREEDLAKCQEVFKAVPGQVGLLVIINGQPAGLDVVSRPGAYGGLHPKLVRSYALEALLEPIPSAPKANGWREEAEAFLREIAAAEETQFPSFGYGADHRFSGKNFGGAALVHAGEVIHAAFFRMPSAATESSGRMASLQQRRRRRFTS